MWHLTKEGKKQISVEVTADEGQYLELNGERVTTDPFEAANWED